MQMVHPNVSGHFEQIGESDFCQRRWEKALVQVSIPDVYFPFGVWILLVVLCVVV